MPDLPTMIEQVARAMYERPGRHPDGTPVWRWEKASNYVKAEFRADAASAIATLGLVPGGETDGRRVKGKGHPLPGGGYRYPANPDRYKP